MTRQFCLWLICHFITAFVSTFREADGLGSELGDLTIAEVDE